MTQKKQGKELDLNTQLEKRPFAAVNHNGGFAQVGRFAKYKPLALVALRL